MFKLAIAIAVLAAITGCRDVRDRGIPVTDPPDLRLEVARAEEARPVADSAAPAPRTRPAPPPSEPEPPAPEPPAAEPPAPEPPAPEPPAPEPPAPEPPAPEATGEPDTSAYVPYPTSEPAPDTGGLSRADTAVQPADPAAPPAPEPQPAPPSSTDAAASPSPDATGIVAAGTVIHAALEDSIHSRHDVSGKVVAGSAMENVTGPDGLVLIAAGSPVQFTVTQVKAGRGDRPGVLEMRVDAITIDGRPRKLQARIQPVSHELRGRGVTGDEAAKVGVGAAGGAVVGRVIGGNTEGAVIGGVVGAAGGAVVASKTASRDVVVKAQTPVVFVLTAPMMAAR